MEIFCVCTNKKKINWEIKTIEKCKRARQCWWCGFLHYWTQNYDDLWHVMVFEWSKKLRDKNKIYLQSGENCNNNTTKKKIIIIIKMQLNENEKKAKAYNLKLENYLKMVRNHFDHYELCLNWKCHRV